MKPEMAATSPGRSGHMIRSVAVRGSRASALRTASGTPRAPTSPPALGVVADPLSQDLRDLCIPSPYRERPQQDQRLARFEPRRELTRFNASAGQPVGVSTVISVESCDRVLINATRVCRETQRSGVQTPTPGRMSSGHILSDSQATRGAKIARISAGSVELRGFEPLTS